jgi:hypothetical protein
MMISAIAYQHGGIKIIDCADNGTNSDEQVC